VNPHLAVAALFLMVGMMLLLPLIPSFVELRGKSDALPLSVVQQNAGEIRHFANSFRDYIKGIEPTLQRCVADGTTATGVLANGEEYVALGRADEALLRALEQRDALHPVVITAGVDLAVPGESTLSKEIYAGCLFTGGDKNKYRAILGENKVHLGASSHVTRWVHALGEFTAERECQLNGRISSDSLIRLGADCVFWRLNAPRIEIGDATVNQSTTSSPEPAGVNSAHAQRFFHEGDFEVQAGETIRGNLVIRGNLHIRSGARICGSVKSTKDLMLGDEVCVEGSLISAQEMLIGANCAIRGPVVAERKMALGTGTRLGSLEYPTTVSAPRIEAEEGSVVFGTLWAREHGEVVANQ